MPVTTHEDSHKATPETCHQLGLDPSNIPQHIAIIMDGNGRWAKQKGYPRTIGHQQGAEALRAAIKACSKFNVKYLSVYAFSTENWNRPTTEVSFLMKMFKSLLMKELEGLNKNNIRVRIIGDISKFSDELKEKIKDIEDKTQNNTDMQLNIMMNYGSRFEIVTAVNRLLAEAKEGKRDSVTEDEFSKYLYTAGIPDPELLIRTSQELRISNFLLWQIGYSELIFVESLWPEFNEDQLVACLQEYQKRNRRFGKVQ